MEDGKRMADIDADANVSVVCHHCGRPTSLTRPDINIRASSVPDALGCALRLAPSQAAAVNETVSTTLEDISELDREISRLQGAVKELQRKRAASQCFVHDLKSLFNPVARLPAEVLSQIFQQCVIVPWLESGIHSDDPFDKTPLIIASVSRYWRSVSLSTPRLWSALSLTLRPKHAKRHMEIARLWLSRSGTSRVSLHIETHGNIRDTMRKLMQLFASQSERWRHIYLKLPFPMLECLSSVQFRLPMLETLRIELWEHSTPSPVDLFAHAPRLRDFTAGEHVTELLTIPWNQLRHFIINRNANSQEVLTLLAQASNVERAQFRVFSLHSVSPHTEAPGSVQLRNLRSLVVVIRDLDPVPFMAILHMPKIHELSLAIDRPLESPRPFWASLSSHGTLEKLALYWNSVFAKIARLRPHMPNIAHVLEDVKQLRVLEILQPEPTFISVDFLERFSQLGQSGAPILGPKLQTLLFHYSYGIDFQSFARTLQSRFPPGSEVTLKTVTILCPQRDLVSTLETFQKSVWWDQIRDVGTNMQLQASESYAAWW